MSNPAYVEGCVIPGGTLHAVPYAPWMRHGEIRLARCGIKVQVQGYAGCLIAWSAKDGAACPECRSKVTGKPAPATTTVYFGPYAGHHPRGRTAEVAETLTRMGAATSISMVRLIAAMAAGGIRTVLTAAEASEVASALAAAAPHLSPSDRRLVRRIAQDAQAAADVYRDWVVG